MPESLASPTAVTIGNFDGVHPGHAALVRAAKDALRMPNAESPTRSDPFAEEPEAARGRVVALCFDPNPLSILRPGSEPPRLSTFEQRSQWLRELGADEVVRLAPSKEFLAQTPEQFLDWLIDTYRPAAIVEGPDFRFGRRRAGSIETLREAGAMRGFETIIVHPVEVVLSDMSLVQASSTLVRWLLARGRVRDARRVLGRPYEIRATVRQGDKRGRTLGFPTANLDHGEMLLPADGIYSGIGTTPDGVRAAAAISVGTKPTFGKSPRVCEAHLLDYDGPLDDYGWTLRLQFHEWIRDQLRYDGVDELVDQLARDVANARSQVLADTSRCSPDSKRLLSRP